MSEQENYLQPETAKKAVEVEYFYQKANMFRVVRVDGIFGGPTARFREIQMAVFSQRYPYPEVTILDHKGDEIMEKRVVKPGIEREIEVSLIMDVDTAKSMIAWLGRHVEQAEETFKNAMQAAQPK